jgi:hypothetical protein
MRITAIVLMALLAGCSIRFAALVETEGATEGTYEMKGKQNTVPTSMFPYVAGAAGTPTESTTTTVAPITTTTLPIRW